MNPKVVGPDYDFAQGPMLFSDTSVSNDLSLVGAGEKSGVFWTFRAKDGVNVWSTQVSPGGVTGGMFALNAKSGAELWQHQLATPNACTGGAAIAGGMVFWGSGDGHNNPGAAKLFFAFGL